MTETVFTVEATPIVFGAGASDETGFHLSRLGATRAMLVSDPHVRELGITERVKASLDARGIDSETFDRVRIEPNEDSILEAVQFASAGEFDGFVGIGGGSSIDTAKLSALFATHGGDLLDYVNLPIGNATPVPGPLLPLVAVPTTAGTGSEATTVAIIDFPRLKVKTGVSHRYLRPRIGIVDPELTLDLPPAVTASAGIDVLCHAIESFTAIPFDKRERTGPEKRPPYQGANPISDLWSSRAIETGGKYLRRAVYEGRDLEARSAMMLAATTAGIGFGNAGVHLPHACAYPIASLKHEYTPDGYPDPSAFIPHGFSVAVTAPASLRFTREATPERHREAARLLGGEDVSVEFGRLLRDIEAPTSLAEFGYGEEDIPELTTGALKQERLLVVSPRPVERNDIEQILRESL